MIPRAKLAVRAASQSRKSAACIVNKAIPINLLRRTYSTKPDLSHRVSSIY